MTTNQNDSPGVETEQCPHPDCDTMFEDFNSISTFIEAGEHADEDHGKDVMWFRGRDGWVLRYEPTGRATSQDSQPGDSA